MVHHGLTPVEALTAATKTAAQAMGLAEHIGTVEEGKLADFVIVDGDPLTEPGLLADPARIWLVLQLGVPVAGEALENRIGARPRDGEWRNLIQPPREGDPPIPSPSR